MFFNLVPQDNDGCRGIYVGHTGRITDTRIKEHKKDCKYDDRTLSLIRYTYGKNNHVHADRGKVL